MLRKSMHDGLWKQNPGVIQLLGLCPTLAVTTTVVNGVSLGIATMLVMVASNGSIAPIRKWIPEEIYVKEHDTNTYENIMNMMLDVISH